MDNLVLQIFLLLIFFAFTGQFWQLIGQLDVDFVADVANELISDFMVCVLFERLMIINIPVRKAFINLT